MTNIGPENYWWIVDADDIRRDVLGLDERDHGDEDDTERRDLEFCNRPGVSCEECGTSMADDPAGNLPCPNCGSRDRRLPRRAGEAVGRTVFFNDVALVNAGIARAAEIERRMVQEHSPLTPSGGATVYPFRSKGIQ